MHNVLQKRSAQHVGAGFDPLRGEDESGQEKTDPASRFADQLEGTAESLRERDPEQGERYAKDRSKHDRLAQGAADGLQWRARTLSARRSLVGLEGGERQRRQHD